MNWLRLTRRWLAFLPVRRVLVSTTRNLRLLSALLQRNGLRGGGGQRQREAISLSSFGGENVTNPHAEMSGLDLLAPSSQKR